MRTEVLHVNEHPEMTFTAKSFTAKSGKMEMPLTITMEGVKKPAFFDLQRIYKSTKQWGS